MSRPARSRAGRAFLDGTPSWLGSQYCMRAAQAQSGRSKKLNPAQRCSSAFNASSQLPRGSAGISVIRSVGTGAGTGLAEAWPWKGASPRRVGMPRGRFSRGAGWRGDVGGADSCSGAWRVLPGRHRHAPVPDPVGAARAAAAAARAGGRRAGALRIGRAPVHDQQHQRAVDRQGVKHGQRGPAHALAGDGGVFAAKQAAPAHQRGARRADQPPRQAPDHAGRTGNCALTWAASNSRRARFSSSRRWASAGA